MTTTKNPYESDDERETPQDATATEETAAVDAAEHDGVELADDTAPTDDPDATQVIETRPTGDGTDDPDATQVIETGAAHEASLADEIFQGEPTQALPVAPADQAPPVAPADQAPPVAPPTQALPVTPATGPAPWESATHTQPYPEQDAPVAPEPLPSAATPATPAASASTVDPATWNAAAQQKAQLPVEDPRERGLRVGTIVWGFVIVAVGAGILALALGATYDIDVALIALLSVAGLVLVVGSIVSSSRRAARERARRHSG
jgi:hypothetical protein